MRRIQPAELLAPGTAVQVGARIGTVHASAIVPAHPCGTVALHHVRFTHRLAPCSIAGRVAAPKPLSRPVVQVVNYASIWTE
jgi:hypothetical protein